MAEPTCPECHIVGTEYLVSKDSIERSRTGQPWFIIVHCNACGHVYDVLAKHVFAETSLGKLVLPKP
jgi:uncharacterized Zn finger protein